MIAGATEPTQRDDRRRAQHLQSGRRPLGREIVCGVYPPGALLPNLSEMCARFPVSRTALREAYSLLSAKALIVARPKIGTRVRPQVGMEPVDLDVLAWHLSRRRTSTFVADLFVLRQMVEPAAAAPAAASLRRTIDRIADAYAAHGRFKDGSRRPDRGRSRFPHGHFRAPGNPFSPRSAASSTPRSNPPSGYSWEARRASRMTGFSSRRGIFEAIRDGKGGPRKVRACRSCSATRSGTCGNI